MSSGSGGPSHPGVTLSNREAVVLLLSTGTATSALSLIRIAEELLMQHRSSASASTSSRHSSRAEMSFDAAVFYFVHVFLRTCPVPPGDVPQILNALLDLVATHLSCGTPSTLSLPFILQVLSGALPLNALASSSSPNGREGGAAVEWGKDKRYSLAICKTLEWYSSTVSHTSTELDVLLFLLRVVSSTLPALACSTLSDQDRIASAALCFYRRSLLPTIQFGIESPMEADVHARTPLVKAALFATQTMVNLSDIVSRRLRQEFLDILFTCDFFRFPQSVLHEWSLVFERLSQDRTFHADAVQFFTPSSSPTSRIVALVHSAEEEERQRVRHLKRLVFYTTSVSPSLLMTDREFCLLLRGRIADTFRSFFPTASGSGAGRRPPSYLPVRHALVLFRVLLTKLDPALLHHFWPLVLPEVARVLTATPWKGVNDGEELLALRIDCLKLLDFALVIMPEAFSPFRWVFFDDMDACTTPTACTENTFTPIVRRFGPAALPLHDVCASATSALVTDWTGYQRPLLRLPTLSYCSLRRFHTCAKTLSLFSQTIGAVAGGGGQDQHESVVHLRLLDGWDEAYVRSILEADLSCVLEKLTLSSSPL
ncbi:hypothetical protein DQ04_03491020 [Trypanosoma grayi]|uniref:hypothetical protein n=1 Tax=Trypanosoma grayi TaxID=71804 RepID=UPI0004F43350|nr:hypothetical protein DQ04_03491020 [Trypanosoma grayi]KEG10625.1 hypothetical protein DQ04_03491020 [Trypanosoma grayi]